MKVKSEYHIKYPCGLQIDSIIETESDGDQNGAVDQNVQPCPTHGEYCAAKSTAQEIRYVPYYPYTYPSYPSYPYQPIIYGGGSITTCGGSGGTSGTVSGDYYPNYDNTATNGTYPGGITFTSTGNTGTNTATTNTCSSFY